VGVIAGVTVIARACAEEHGDAVSFHTRFERQKRGRRVSSVSPALFVCSTSIRNEPNISVTQIPSILDRIFCRGEAMTGIEAAAIVKVGASAGAGAVFKAAIERAEKILKGPTRTLAVKALAALSGYGAFLDETNERVSTFKTFANPTQPVSLLDHFVTIELEQFRKKKNITQDDLIEKLIKPARIVISATAGYGKSMAMRYIALSLYENPRGRIPLFLELRHLNRVNSPDILTFINATYRRVTDIQIENLKQGLRGGAFVLLLDGFDELNHEIRPTIEAQILELAREYPLCSFVVSGRPDDRFSAWRAFSRLKIAPMSKYQAVELITKLEYDKGVKQRFITKIKKGLYETHESFLSTPLLAILMLLTYEQNANIPDKMHLFYAKAFETLFHKHDALKEQYARKRQSNLQVDEFEKIFSIFCLKTYVLEKIEFSKTEILKFIGDALGYEKSNVGSEDYLFDIEEAVCLVMREGQSFFFVHRSFQEYFTAVFLSNCPEDIRDEFIDKVSSRYWDNVLPMLFDMSADQLEPSWVVRNADTYLASVGEGPDKMSPLEARFQGMGFQRHHHGRAVFSSVMPGKFSKFISIMRRFYPSIENNGADLNFSKIEDFVFKNWDNIPFNREIEHRIGDDEVIMSRDIEFCNLPYEILESTGLPIYAGREYNEIKNVRSKVDMTQKAKTEFLSKLFSDKE